MKRGECSEVEELLEKKNNESSLDGKENGENEKRVAWRQ